MSSPINKYKESKDLIDFDCDFNSPTHKFSEIQLMFDPLIPTSVTSDKNKRDGHVFLNPYAEPSDTSNECKTEHSPFDLMLDYSSGPIGSHLVKPDELLLPHTVMDANNVLKDENFHLSNKRLILPSVMDVQYDTCSAKPQVSTSSEIDLKGNQHDLFSFSQTVTPWCLRKDDKNNPHCTTINQEGLSSTTQLTHFIANSQPTDELKLFVSFVQSLRRQKYNKPNTSTLISDLDSDSKQNENNSVPVYSPPDTWAYDCVYSDSVTNVMLKNSHTSINLLSLTSSSAGYQQMNPLWKTETAASNVSYIYPKCKEYFGSQNNTPAHWTNTPRWCIPQLEVRITAHLNTRKKSYQSFTTNNPNSVNSETTNNSSVNPRLRLVCDPTSTLVNELMLEALANDLIPQEIVLDVNHFQLRLQGRAELLRPDARLCDCYQVQLCHRLDQPLRLILEPKYVDQPYIEKTFSTNEQFIPQNFFTNNRPTPTEEDIFISYSVFQNALEKFRSCIVENYAQVDSESWLKDVHCASSSLCQSVKAVLAAVCYGMAFSDVINALGNIQVCIMDIVYDIGLNNKVTGFKRHDNKNFNSFRSDSQQDTTQENWFSSSYKRKQTRTSPTLVSNLQSTLKNTSKTLVNLKRDIKPQSRKKLHNLILSLTKNLLCQLSAFFIWRQVNISVNPQLIGNINFLSNGVSNESFSYLTNKQLYHTKNGRPKAMLITDDVDGEFFNDRQQSEQKKEVKSSIDCLDAIVVGLIAIHNPPPRKTIGAYNSNVISNNTTVNSSLSSSSSPSQTNPNTSSTRTDGYYCVRLGLVYAGRPLSKVYPSALTTHHDNINDNHYRSSPYKNHAKEISWTSNHLSRDSQNKYTRDYFISDPGRYQTIQSGFPKVLQFDQWFKFPSFTISQLPREAMLAISLFWCKKLNTDNSDVDGTLIGWVNLPLFDINGRLKQNTMIVGLWPPSELMHEYRPTWSQSNSSPGCPVVQLCFPEYQYEIEFPVIIQSESELENSNEIQVSSFHSLCSDAKQSINEAKSAIFMQILNPELSFKSVDGCLMAYSAASSSVHLSKRQERVPIPVLHLAVLNSMNSSFNQYNGNVIGNISCNSGISGSGSGSSGHLGNNSNSSNNNNNNTNSCNSSNNSISNNLTTCNINSVACYLPCPPAIAIEVLWNLRYSICDVPDAMIAFVISCLVSWPQATRQNLKSYTDKWCWQKLLKEIYSLLAVTPVPYPGLILRLLSSDVADQGIRHWATRALSLLSSDNLLLYLPQIIEAVNHDLYLDYSGLVSLLLYRAAFSMRFANSLYWYLYPMLHHPQPLSEWKLQRFRFIQAALYWNANSRLHAMWKRQEEMINHLSVTATKVKQARPNASVRENILYTHLKRFMSELSKSYHDISSSSSHIETTDKNISMLRSNSWADDQLISDFSKLDSEWSRNKSADNILSEYQLSQYDLGLRMPYNPGLITHRLDITACSYFTSFTCPLRLVFHALDAGTEPFMVMFKVGDDLRLDSLICQLTFLMDRIWLDAGLDLRMIHFRILPTEEQKGFIELVSECSTLRQIQQQGGGLTGPFKEGVITKWLQSQNITELDYKRALDNFLRSLAGCCVATYILGVGDRHNDNIMIRYSGHVFHVDFSKVFGNSQTFAGIKRDRVPFVLTQDMLHVLNTYSKDVTNLPYGVNNSSGFGYTPGHGSSHSQQGVQIFIDRCCEAYNLLRHRSYQLISLLELSLSMNIPGLNRDCIRFVLRALRLELNDQEASQYFTELVRKTLHSKSSSLNFFVHGLAQVKQVSHGGGVSGTNTNASDNNSPPIINNQFDNHWNTDNNMNNNNNKRVNNNNSNISGKLVDDSKIRSPPTISNSLSNYTGTGQIFSFNPKRFTNDSDGTIDAIVVETAVKKKTDDKHSDYYFPMNVWRENCRVPTRVYRRVSDLEELETRLQERFPNSAVTKTVSHIMNALNSISISSTRSQDHVQSLTDSLLSDDDIVSKSAIVYTFFHSVLFDERFTAEDMPSQGLTTSTSSSLINCWSSSSPLQDYLPEKSKEYTTPLLIPSLSSSSLSSFHLFHNNSDDLLTSTYKVDHLPAVHIQLYLSENSRRLDVLIKHARCLYIPGSNEPPDVYIKVYLLSGRRRKTTKHKTNIVRRSSFPSFNITFSYDLIPNDIQCGFIEVSAWHSVHIGENIPFGQIYIQLKSIRPGHVYSNWYILCSDPACLS